MQNIRSNELIPGATLRELEERIPKEDRGPPFRVGEIVPVKGYNYRVTGIKKNRLFLKPHGPIKE